MTASIRIIIPYFGQWPEWFNHFMLSCQHNSTINWLFFTDCGLPIIQPNNVDFIETRFSEYQEIVSNRLNIDFHPTSPYKLCDLKPAYGYIHQEYLEGYDFFGFGDIDVIYGNLRHVLKHDLLVKYQLISTHSTRISGHFCLLKNNAQMRCAFKKIPDWAKHFENPEHLSIDESKFTKVFMPHRKHPKWLKKLYALFSPYWRNNYFQEQYSTILAPTPWMNGSAIHPQEWYWKDGKLTNQMDGEREFLYLHFMNWKSNKWLRKERDKAPAWSSKAKFQFDHHLTEQGFTLNRQGIQNIQE